MVPEEEAGGAGVEVEGLLAAVEEVVGLTPSAAASVMVPGAFLEKESKSQVVPG
jgi:hypothetical protein